MNLLEATIKRIHFTRNYTLTLLDATPVDEWFRQPVAGLTHVAWQVGHLAMAEFGLTMAARRGPRDSDAAIITPEFRKLFGRGSKVGPDSSGYPPAAELRAALDRVHQAVLAELSAATLAELEGPPLVPLSMAKTKMDAIQFCPEHEMLHAGQIGLLRRMLGHEPLR